MSNCRVNAILNNMIKLKQDIIKEKIVNKDNMLILILSGILLLVIAWPMEKDVEKAGSMSDLWDRKSSMVMETDEKQAMQTQEVEIFVPQNYLEEEYIIKGLESRLEEILFSIQGVGQVKVMITLASQGEKIVEKDIPLERSNIIEEDSEGGSRNTNQMNSQEETVYCTNSQGDKVPYVIKETGVEVAGVSVVAEGGNNEVVQKNIVEVIQALFGIEEHKIKVVKMKYQE